jgi:hypothetical protein
LQSVVRWNPAGDLGIARRGVDAFVQHSAHGRSLRSIQWWRQMALGVVLSAALVVGIVIATAGDVWRPARP